jgi:biotin operon repressor
MSDRQFKGIWIPIEIWSNLELTAAERVLWAEIDSFTSANSGYYKTNEQAAEELGISERQVSRAFQKLEMMGCIVVTKSGVRRFARSTPWRDVHDSEATNTRHHGEVSSPPWRGIKNSKEQSIKHIENKEVMLPFEGDEMKELWNVWVRERKAYTKGTYTPYAQQRAANKLGRLSTGDINRARLIIDQSITNAWKDFFPIREDRTKQRPNLDREQALKWSTQ